MSDRDEFEAWVKTVNQAEIKWIGHSYANAYMAAQWEGWQAAKSHMSGWQPIETCPKHEHVLFAAYYVPSEEAAKNGATSFWSIADGIYTGVFYTGIMGGKPSHWMRLPKAPSSPKQETGDV